jgi:hypothetical protein
MQRGSVGIAILGITMISTMIMIVKELVRVMRMPDRRVLVGVHFDHRNAGQYDRYKEQGENNPAYQACMCRIRGHSEGTLPYPAGLLNKPAPTMSIAQVINLIHHAVSETVRSPSLGLRNKF